MLLKGAPDYLLKKCRKIMNSNGDEVPLTSQHIADLIKLQNDWCILGQRVLLICKKSIEYSEPDSSFSFAASEVESLVYKTNDLLTILRKCCFRCRIHAGLVKRRIKLMEF